MTDQLKLPGALSNRLSDDELASLQAQAEGQLATLEPADAALDINALSTPELDELSAAKTPEDVARVEARIRARIADRQARLQQPRKVQVTR